MIFFFMSFFKLKPWPFSDVFRSKPPPNKKGVIHKAFSDVLRRFFPNCVDPHDAHPPSAAVESYKTQTKNTKQNTEHHQSNIYKAQLRN